ncbi:MAG: AIPR family protein [Bacteroidetes bacterium]|nr:AIPR family protein [Bacteroidota bacterium]
MISLEEFHEDFLQSILSDAESRGLMKPQSFFENVCEELTNIGDLTKNYTVAEYTKRGLEVYGYDYDDERRILSLLVHQFFQEEEIHTLTQNQISVKFNRLRTFLTKCFAGMYKEMEETSESYSMAYNILNYFNKQKISKVRLVILTDGKATRNLTELPTEVIENINIEFRVVDIEYIYKIFLSEYTEGEFEIDVNLPCLQTDTGSNEYQSYLSVISGDLLFQIYEKYGQKLLEQNVRTFLQFRGNVNKGLRNTIEFKPEMFFAYNNGITVTASSIEFNSKGNISKIKNFQIVNGGQTTSAIYAAKKTNKLDISDISVQMKLSIVKDKEKQSDFISKVSEYANTQNKVNKSDFFSNSPFHKEFKNYSKRIWVSAVGGSQKRTHWFYERVRGEYLNEQAYLTPAKKKQFQLENPKKQTIDKTFLSKSENAWQQKPDIVSRGAQYSFAAFAENVTNKLEVDNQAITENYFKNAVARVILFRSVEKLISNATWYDGGFRAQTVAYTISYLSFLIEKTNKHLNFLMIWENQELPSSLINLLEKISKKTYDKIMSPPEGHANISQWAKQSKCWDEVKNLRLSISISRDLLIDKEDQKYIKKDDKENKKIDTGIDIQIFVTQTKTKVWRTLFEYYKKYESEHYLSSMQMDILKKISNGILKLPSEKQSKILYQLYEQAKDEGVDL